MNWSQAVDMVFNEFAYSVEKHGTWADYSIEQMLSVIIEELVVEAGNAEAVGDITGQHGVIRELAQVAATSIKAIMVLSARASITLAEMVRAAGEHSEDEGRALPSSPSLYQRKESRANHPIERSRYDQG